jgi:hypothetical protein
MIFDFLRRISLFCRGNRESNRESNEDAILRNRREWLHFHYRESLKDQEKRIAQWCEKNGYTGLQYCGASWWAIPPGGYLPIPVSLEDIYMDFMIETSLDFIDEESIDIEEIDIGEY